MFLSTAGMMLLGCLVATPYQVICFLVGILSLRRRLGGYHAKTPLRCLFLSIGVSILCLSIVNSLVRYGLSILIWILFISLSFAVFNSSPYSHPNCPLTPDELGNPVPANAHVENNTFIVELDYTSVTYPVTYGIQLYSDTEFKKYFYSGGWESYVAPWNYTLALTPREWRTEFLDETAKALRWSAVYNSSFRQETHYWVNETGIYNQFYCHVNIAGLKPTWHLEPLRPDYGYGYTLSMGCNPE